MFIKTQDKNSIDDYTTTLLAISSLSKLFSENTSPYIGYRVVENIFCESFKAENLARADCSADAKKNRFGIGIKTFLNENGRTLQKIAEFNKESNEFKNKNTENLISLIAKLRNERINFTKRAYGIDTMLYHCVVRDPKKIMIYETPMDTIDISTITNIKKSVSTTISFSDSLNEYSFNLSKSTLYRRFITDHVQSELQTRIIQNPYSLIRDLVTSHFSAMDELATFDDDEYIILPLFSDINLSRCVPKKSGLNQWNASGRKRNPNEIYIKIPSWIHRVFPDFFPEKNVSFDLKLPDGTSLNAKICQDDNKALMSNPNAALGEWLLRKVLNIEPRTLLTYSHLTILGIDSVVIFKQSFRMYRIDFKSLGTYDDFFVKHNY